QEVGRNTTITAGGEDAYSPFLNSLTLTGGTLDGLDDIGNARAIGGASSIQTVYHESTHAYFDRHSDDSEVARLIRGGESYYEGAPLQRGGTTSNPGRVFQEAAASYVGHRVSVWWQAYDMLTFMQARGPLNDATIARVRSDYERGMTERVFGYS